MTKAPELFITGAESFVGKNLIKHCREQGYKYSGVDLVASEDIHVSYADICDSSLDQLIPHGATVIHLAAVSRDSDCTREPALANRINIEGTLNVLRCAKLRSATQFIFASSEWVYGQVSNESVQTEIDRLKIDQLDSIYAITKAIGERYLYLLRDSLAVTILRFGIIYGPRITNWSAVESLFDAVMQREEVTVGSLRAGRRFIHVDDISAGIIASIGCQDFEIFNLSGDSTITLNEVLRESMLILGKHPRIIETAPNNVSLRNPSNEKAKRQLSWSPRIPLPDGLRTLLTNDEFGNS